MVDLNLSNTHPPKKEAIEHILLVKYSLLDQQAVLRLPCHSKCGPEMPPQLRLRNSAIRSVHIQHFNCLYCRSSRLVAMQLNKNRAPRIRNASNWRV